MPGFVHQSVVSGHLMRFSRHRNWYRLVTGTGYYRYGTGTGSVPVQYDRVWRVSVQLFAHGVHAVSLGPQPALQLLPRLVQPQVRGSTFRVALHYHMLSALAKEKAVSSKEVSNQQWQEYKTFANFVKPLTFASWLI